METQLIRKKLKKGESKIYKILLNGKIIDARLSKNDYTAATVYISDGEGYHVDYHSTSTVVNPVTRKGYLFLDMAHLR